MQSGECVRHTVFRDLKPVAFLRADASHGCCICSVLFRSEDNVVIDEAHHALLTDFGLSKALTSAREPGIFSCENNCLAGGGRPAWHKVFLWLCRLSGSRDSSAERPSTAIMTGLRDLCSLQEVTTIQLTSTTWASCCMICSPDCLR